MTEYYGSADGFKAYHIARGNAAASFDNDEIEIALLVASEWIDASFASSFPGRKVGLRSQVRQWPRSDAWDSEGFYIGVTEIPPEVVNATYEAAARQLTTPGVFFKDYTPGKYRNVSISGAISVEYAVGDAYSFQTQMPMINAILSNVLTARGRGNFSSLSGDASRV